MILGSKGSVSGYTRPDSGLLTPIGRWMAAGRHALSRCSLPRSDVTVMRTWLYMAPVVVSLAGLRSSELAMNRSASGPRIGSVVYLKGFTRRASAAVLLASAVVVCRWRGAALSASIWRWAARSAPFLAACLAQLTNCSSKAFRIAGWSRGYSSTTGASVGRTRRAELFVWMTAQMVSMCGSGSPRTTPLKACRRCVLSIDATSMLMRRFSSATGTGFPCWISI